MLTIAFLLIGPAPFLKNLVPTTSLIQGTGAVLGTGYGMVVVSTFGRSQSAAIRHGYNDDLDTYMFISSKFLLLQIYLYQFIPPSKITAKLRTVSWTVHSKFFEKLFCF